jgi:hypothetical protein
MPPTAKMRNTSSPVTWPEWRCSKAQETNVAGTRRLPSSTVIGVAVCPATAGARLMCRPVPSGYAEIRERPQEVNEDGGD